MDLLGDNTFTVRSFGPSAAYAGWLLEQFGAEVDHESALDPESVGAFFNPKGRTSASPNLVGTGATTLITDAPVNATNRALVSRIALSSRVVWITPWGFDSANAEVPATDLLLHAAGGWMSAVGEPGQEPLGPPGSQGQLTAGLFAAIAALSPVVSRDESNGVTDVSIVESVAATMIYDVVSHQFRGVTRQRAGHRFSRPNCTLATLPCKDGFVGLHIALHRQWLTACAFLGYPELATDPRFADPLSLMANIDELEQDYLLPWLAERSRWAVYHAFEAVRVPAAALPDVSEVLASPHLEERKSWADVTTPAGRGYRVPGPPARIHAVREGWTGHAEDSPWKPGAIRVVDLSMGWAGPYVSHILANYGADVIKVEGLERFDWWRGTRPQALGDTLHEQAMPFCSSNRGKRGVTFELTTDEGNHNARRLISQADVIVENFAPGVFEKLGLTYESLAATNPGLIMLRQPAFGSTGPESGYVGFGMTIEGMSGLTSLMGYKGGPPQMMSNAFGDPISGLNGAVAVLAALTAREHDGKGRLIEAAQLEGFLPFVAEDLIEYQRTGVLPVRNGNRRKGHVPSGLFPCAGEDRWIAIDVDSDVAWSALAMEIGLPWATAGAYSTLAGRESDEVLIEANLGQWTASFDRDDLAARLSSAGCPAAPLNSEPDLLASELFLEREFYQPVERAFVGTLLYPSMPMRTASERPTNNAPAPTLGQHTDEVLAAMGAGAGQAAPGDAP